VASGDLLICLKFGHRDEAKFQSALRANCEISRTRRKERDGDQSSKQSRLSSSTGARARARLKPPREISRRFHIARPCCRMDGRKRERERERESAAGGGSNYRADARRIRRDREGKLLDRRHVSTRARPSGRWRCDWRCARHAASRARTL